VGELPRVLGVGDVDDAEAVVVAVERHLVELGDDPTARPALGCGLVERFAPSKTPPTTTSA
jgi:hypothetical protein